MKVGFTGTRKGMTDEQLESLHKWISERRELDEFHHGDCIGADDDAADTIREINMYTDEGARIKVVCHPPTDKRRAAFNTYFDEIREPKDYFERNHNIVDETDVLIAAPQDMVEEQRSGTWATVRYARKCGKPIVILWPNAVRATTEGEVPR